MGTHTPTHTLLVKQSAGLWSRTWFKRIKKLWSTKRVLLHLDINGVNPILYSSVKKFLFWHWSLCRVWSSMIWIGQQCRLLIASRAPDNLVLLFKIMRNHNIEYSNCCILICVTSCVAGSFFSSNGVAFVEECNGYSWTFFKLNTR